MSASTISRNQAIWRSRRGLLELDLYLTPFAEACFEDLAVDLKQQYGELLEREDPEILAWLKAGADVPSEYEPIIARIREFAQSRPGFERAE